MFCAGLVIALDAVLVPAAAPGAVDHVDQDERLGRRAIVAADGDHRVAALAGRHDLVRRDLGQRAEHRVDDAVAGQRPGRDRRRHVRD